MVDAITPEQLHPELVPFLAAMPGFVVAAETLSDLRAAMPVAPPGSTDAVERTEHTIDDDRGLVVRAHVPKRTEGPSPCVVSFHGGGYVLGNRDMDDHKLERWARHLGCVGVSVEYRLAPETPYPGPLDDCFDALRWVVDHAETLGIDRTRIGVAGVSAGAGLAAAVAIRARDEGGPPLRFQLLECPMLDDRQRTRSSRLDGLHVWNKHSNEFGWRSYLGELYGTDDVPVLAAPARALDHDLPGLPPAFVAVGSIDGFHDEDVEYATRLNHAGVPTELHVYPGVPHGFQLFEDFVVTRQAARDAQEWLALQIAVPA